MKSSLGYHEWYPSLDELSLLQLDDMFFIRFLAEAGWRIHRLTPLLPAPLHKYWAHLHLEATWSQLGANLGILGALWDQLGSNLRQLGTNLGQLETNLGQIGANLEPT
jgi:hypothetical protein